MEAVINGILSRQLKESAADEYVDGILSCYTSHRAQEDQGMIDAYPEMGGHQGCVEQYLTPCTGRPGDDRCLSRNGWPPGMRRLGGYLWKEPRTEATATHSAGWDERKVTVCCIGGLFVEGAPHGSHRYTFGGMG
ncbi:hypothetical protein QE152_g38617 [Popillia japonica]|uniref:Uncharacterized protein n=1 Tax=Popillia japonica TaxID=7064 RepID=A0AAW1HWF2_POPJA